MAKIEINGKKYDIDLLVFDKDGLMIDCQAFWIEMANARLRTLLKYCTPDDCMEFAEIIGVSAEVIDGNIFAKGADNTGIIAVASPDEEAVVLTYFLSEKLGLLWTDARSLAIKIFDESDKIMDFKLATKPMPGCKELMQSLIRLDIPYGVATSDTYDRTKTAMTLFDAWKGVRFVVTHNDVETGKPEPDMLLYISQKQNVPLNKIIMIGDSYVDVKMAKAAGAIGLGVTKSIEMRERMKPYATEIISSLEEIKIEK